MHSFKNGMAHVLAIFIALSFLIALLFFARQNFYSFSQNFAYKIGVNLNNVASDSYVNWINSQPDEFENTKEATFLNRKVDFADVLARIDSRVLGESTPSNGEKWIEVDLSDQKLYMKEGNSTVGSFLVSTGKWAPTPTGEWRIWSKLRYTRMKGG